MIIEIKNVSKQYKMQGGEGKHEVLKDVSLSINSGDSLAIVGPSGSGKSTLLNVIGALDKPSSGDVFFNGEPIWDWNENQLAFFRNNHVGFVFQLHHLLPQLTLIENILVPLIPGKNKSKMKTASSRAMELLKLVGLDDKIRQRPGQLSVGECQRAAVVRALINNPEFILADEPTGSLDQQSAENLGELLAEINKIQEVAVIVVTHSEGLAKKMDSIYRLDDGKLVLQ